MKFNQAFTSNNKIFLNDFQYIFWDFDGVIKDSIELKSNAFFKLFSSFGNDLAIRVRSHHEKNGGLSRFEKLPIYLRWAGENPSDKLISDYCQKFSNIVKQDVIDSEWVPGVHEFIIKKNKKSLFFIVTAIPQGEIEEILTDLKIMPYFEEVIGAPTKKYEAIMKLLGQYSIKPKDSIMIGDSDSDFYAAKDNSVKFVLRRTKYNINLQKELNCFKINDFRGL